MEHEIFKKVCKNWQIEEDYYVVTDMVHANHTRKQICLIEQTTMWKTEMEAK